MKGVYTPSKEIQEYHYHKNRVRQQSWVRFCTLLAIIIVTVLFIKTHKDAYEVQQMIGNIWDTLGNTQQDYTYLAKGYDEVLLQGVLNKLYVLSGGILRLQMLEGIILMFLGVVYVRVRGNISQSKKILNTTKQEELRA